MYIGTKTKRSTLLSARKPATKSKRKTRVRSRNLMTSISAISPELSTTETKSGQDPLLAIRDTPLIDPESGEKLLELAVAGVKDKGICVQSSIYDDLGDLPDSYGTGKVFLTARDPHWLYCYWDFTGHQMWEMRTSSCDGQLKVRVYRGQPSSGLLQQEISIQGESRNCAIHVGMPQNDFYAEFGFYDNNGTFQVRSRSHQTRTPADRVSDNTEARFVTIPFRISFRELFEIVRKYFRDSEELLDVLYRLQLEGFDFPFDYDRIPFDQGDSELLGRMFGLEMLQRIRMGSEELTTWLQKRMIEQTSSGLFAPSSRMLGTVETDARPFWFNVNAELIVYGMTERNASVVFDGKKIPLNPDGSFRFQFALPDGAYMTPITATSPDHEDVREVHLHFQRNSRSKGEVGVVEHSAELRPPPTQAYFQIGGTTLP